ncbi:hypothetical protein QQ008_29410 [Fulvivirgaceae bacterium BMA10]|uniref:Uncharacterized protein n=1 Tax=Splendidivirga corallicola TaxID=3051826 RepID=A0ABT8KZI8_9BACT|nr:hypothetical protein [Fulvivirgaceae bacterium BMA10]
MENNNPRRIEELSRSIKNLNDKIHSNFSKIKSNNKSVAGISKSVLTIDNISKMNWFNFETIELHKRNQVLTEKRDKLLQEYESQLIGTITEEGAEVARQAEIKERSVIFNIDKWVELLRKYEAKEEYEVCAIIKSRIDSLKPLIY